MWKLRAQLGNRTTQLLPPYNRADLDHILAFQPKNYFWSPKYRSRHWDGWIRLLRFHSVPTGFFLDRIPMLQDAGYEIQLIDKREALQFKDCPIQEDFAPGVSLRPYQVECLQAMHKARRTGGLILSATGTGKTLIAGAFAKWVKGLILYVVDELTLLDQSRAEIETVAGERVGIVGNQEFQPRRITVATIQTLHKHQQKPEYQAWRKSVECMFVDEIHVMLNRRQFAVVQGFQPKVVFGMTATLELDKDYIRAQATALCGPVVFRYSYSEGREDRVLTPGICLGVDLEREWPEDTLTPAERYTKRIVLSKTRNQLLEDLVREGYRRGKHIIVLVERLRHLAILSKRLQGIPHEVVFGKRTRTERKQIKQRAETGETRVILCNRVFKKGISIRRVDVIIDGASQRNANDPVQKFGRGVRLLAKKAGLLYFDIGERRPKSKVPTYWNQYSGSTRVRRRALLKIGVPMEVTTALQAGHLYDQAERLLTGALATLNQPSLLPGKQRGK